MLLNPFNKTASIDWQQKQPLRRRNWGVEPASIHYVWERCSCLCKARTSLGSVYPAGLLSTCILMTEDVWTAQLFLYLFIYSSIYRYFVFIILSLIPCIWPLLNSGIPSKITTTRDGSFPSVFRSFLWFHLKRLLQSRSFYFSDQCLFPP